MSATPGHLQAKPRPVMVGAVQLCCSWDRAANIARAERLVREAAAKGAQIYSHPGTV